MLAASLSVMSVLVTSLFVSPPQAQQLIGAGATVLDARDKGFFWGHLPGARPINWLDYRDGWGSTGRLPEDVGALGQKLAALGISDQRAVVVYGEAQQGFGEEGRIAWMLSYLGHPRVFVLDGGIAAWQQAGRPLERGSAAAAGRGEFHPRVKPQLRADKAAVQTAGQRGAVVLDVRTLAEWHGATPYLEARGGHIPGARHLDWRALLTPQGTLRPVTELRALLQPLGIDPDAASGAAPEVIVYCTGGVRSAYVWAGLRSVGVAHVRNYDASLWEWAADRSLPLVREPPAKRTQP